MYKKRKGFITSFALASVLLSTAFTNTKVLAVDEGEVIRVWGKNRYETAVKISEQGWHSGTEYAFIASGEGYADALCAAPLAKLKDAPILLTKKNKLDEVTLNELKRLGVKNIYIIGGEGSVSKEVEEELKSEITPHIKRIQGRDRYETSVKIAEELANNHKIILASGENYADALSAAPVAAMNGFPIILTRAEELPWVSRKYIDNSKVTSTYIIGGPASVGEGIKRSVPGVKRIYGENRFETNAKVVKAFESNFDFKKPYIALGAGETGNEFADALAGAALAGKNRAPMILTSKSLNNETRKLVKDKFSPTSTITVLGGINNISNKLINEIEIKASFLNEEKAEYNKNIKDNVVIAAEDVKLKDLNIEGNLYIEEDEANISNVKVKGTIFVDPGREGKCDLENVEADKIVVLSGDKDSSIYLKDVNVNELEVLSKSSVRIALDGSTNILKTFVKGNGILENRCGSFGKVELPNILTYREVELKGSFKEKVIVKGQAELKAPSGADIDKVEIRSEENDDILLDGRFNDVNVYGTANIRVTKDSIGTIEGQDGEARSKAKVNVAKDSQIKVRNIRGSNITGEGKDDARRR